MVNSEHFTVHRCGLIRTNVIVCNELKADVAVARKTGKNANQIAVYKYINGEQAKRKKLIKKSLSKCG